MNNDAFLHILCGVPKTAHTQEYFKLFIGLCHTNVNINAKLGLFGMSALSYAVCSSDYATACIIMGTLQCDVDVADIRGFSALHHAAFRGELDLVKTLLAHGANLYAKTHGGMLASELAHSFGHPNVVKKLHKTEIQQRKLAFAMITQKRLAVDTWGSALSTDMVRKISLIAKDAGM